MGARWRRRSSRTSVACGEPPLVYRPPTRAGRSGSNVLLCVTATLSSRRGARSRYNADPAQASLLLPHRLGAVLGADPVRPRQGLLQGLRAAPRAHGLPPRRWPPVEREGGLLARRVGQADPAHVRNRRRASDRADDTERLPCCRGAAVRRNSIARKQFPDANQEEPP
jgi:hypothetical protein